MYLDESDIIEPPEGGWPSITQETLGCLSKTGQVLSLLRHLPYIRSRLDGIEPQACPNCSFADYQSIAQRLEPENPASIRITTEDAQNEFGFQKVPPHVIGLTCATRETSPIFLLDTQLGAIFWIGGYTRVKDTACREPIIDYDPYEDGTPENEVAWRGDATAWAVEDFFEVLKGSFRKFMFVPNPSGEVFEDGVDVFHGDRPDMVPTLQTIFREHGWPDMTQYQKAECIESVRTALADRYSINTYK